MTGRRTTEPELQNIPPSVRRVVSTIEREHKKSMLEIALLLRLDYAAVEQRIMEAANG